jgi:hypothetical protein
MLQAGLSGSEAWIVEQATYRLGPFARGVVGGPWQGLCDTLQALAPGHLKIVVPALFHGLREAGWIDMGRVYSVDHPTKRHAYRAPDWTGSKSDARRLLELPSPSSAEIIARVKG